MKILAISPNYPFPINKGERIRVNSVLKALAPFCDQLDLLCLDRRKSVDTTLHSEVDNLNLLCVHKINKKFAYLRMLKALFTGETLTSAFFNEPEIIDLMKRIDQNLYDRVIVFSSNLSFLLPELSRLKSKIYFDLIDFDSLKWDLLSSKVGLLRTLYKREHKILKSEEEKIIKQAEACFVISEREINSRKLDPELRRKVKIVNQYVPTPSKTEHIEKNPNQIIFTGQMDYYPNIEAVTFFHDQVLPELKKLSNDVEFVVAGRNPSETLIRHCSQAAFTGAVDDISSHLLSSTLVVVPLKSVFGVPSKIVEAMTLKLPIVLTSQAADTLGLSNGQEALIADEPRIFAESCYQLISNPDLGLKLVENATSFLNDKHTFEKISEQVKEHLEII